MPLPPESVVQTVERLHPSSPGQTALKDYVLSYLRKHGHEAVGRALPEHVTGSTLVLDPDRVSTLLCYHRKGGFWVQPGGHHEPQDGDLITGALRELREETGLARYVVPTTQPADLDRHRLGDGFGRCTWHIDVAFLVIADPQDPLRRSEESDEVAWWPLDDLPAGSVPGLAHRLADGVAFASRHVGQVVP